MNLVIDMINKNGLQKTISYMRTHRNEFLTQKGEYVFIFSKYEENYYFLYHHHNELDDKNMINAQTGLNNSGVCDETICNINDVIHKLAVFADKYNEGFEEYRWFSPISNEIINKRSYIKKIFKKNDTDIGEKDIYIGSGSTITNKRKKIDFIIIGIYIGIILLFALLWKIFSVDFFINNIYISTLIYIVIISILIFNLLNHENSTKNLEQIEDEYNTINREIIGLAGLGLAMALFFARVIDRKKSINKNCIKFL